MPLTNDTNQVRQGFAKIAQSRQLQGQQQAGQDQSRQGFAKIAQSRQASRTGKAGAIGFLAQKMLGGVNKQKKRAGRGQSLSQQAIGQQTTGQDSITRLRAKQGKSPGALADRRL